MTYNRSSHHALILAFVLFISAQLMANESYTDFLHASLIHLEKRNLDEALLCITKALDQKPETVEDKHACVKTLFQIGNHFFDRKEPEKALCAFKKILTISDKFAAVHHNIGFTLAERYGNYQESIEWYRKALALDPHNIATHFCLALSLLAVGNLPEGFLEYEWRWLRGKKSPRQFSWPLEKLWNGTISINNKRVLIRSEQGLGDVLQFIRYAQLLKNDGATVIAELPRPLVPLALLCPYIDHVIILGSPLPAFDFQLPFINLPLAYRTTLQTVPVPIPYLYADKNLTELWRTFLANDPNFKIGICWHGDITHSPDKFMPLSYFARLTTIPHVSIYSLQQVTGLDQLTNTNNTFVIQFNDTFDKTHGRFMDTAAVMKNLDLVITVDTSIAHLAGGLGVPVWVLLPAPAEWRWLTNRNDSVWYPTMRLFRQKKSGNWTEVIDTVCNELITLRSH